MKKILNVYQTYDDPPYGGIEQSIRQYSYAFYKYYNIKSEILFTSTKKKFKENNYLSLRPTKYYLKLSSCSIPSLSFYLYFFKLKKNFDKIIFHYPFPMQDFCSFFLKKYEYSVYYHSDIVRQKILNIIYTPLKIFFLSRAKNIFVSSEEYFKTSPTLQRFKEKVVIVPFIFSLDFVNKREYTLPFKKNNFYLYIGRKRHYKNFDNLIKAFKKMKDKNLIFVGDLNKNEQKTLSSNIYHYNYITDDLKYFLISNSIAILLPSSNRAEAFGYILLEAIALGKPIISTNLNNGILKLFDYNEKLSFINFSKEEIIKKIMNFDNHLVHTMEKVLNIFYSCRNSL